MRIISRKLSRKRKKRIRRDAVYRIISVTVVCVIVGAWRVVVKLISVRLVKANKINTKRLFRGKSDFNTDEGEVNTFKF